MTLVHRITSCPGCAAPVEPTRSLFTSSLLGEPCSILECRSCSLVFKGVVPTKQGLSKLYSADYSHFQLDPKTAGRAEINSARGKIERCKSFLKPGPEGLPRLIDVGCGSGGFVELARQMGWAAQGIDTYLPAPLESTHLRKQAPQDLPEASFDVAVLLNVAEHLIDPVPFFVSVQRLLRPGGVLLLTCPFGASMACRKYQRQWVHMALDEHLLFWTPGSLTRALRRSGFNGPVRFRIAGSPFPYGRTHVTNGTADAHAAENQPGWQRAAWKVARKIQEWPPVATTARALIDWTETGDYLELMVRREA